MASRFFLGETLSQHVIANAVFGFGVAAALWLIPGLMRNLAIPQFLIQTRSKCEMYPQKEGLKEFSVFALGGVMIHFTFKLPY